MELIELKELYWTSRSVFALVALVLLHLYAPTQILVLALSVFVFFFNWAMSAFSWRFSFLSSGLQSKSMLFQAVWKIEYTLHMASHIITAPFRVLPDVIIIGVAKGGTTALSDYMMSHPDVLGMSGDASLFRPFMRDSDAYILAEKESYFFNGRFGRHFAHQQLLYRACFPTIFTVYWRKMKSLMAGRSGKIIVVDADPCVTWTLYTAKRIRACAPNAKLVWCLRDPCTRAFSCYNMDCSVGLFMDRSTTSDHDFDDVITQCIDNRPNWEIMGTQYPTKAPLPVDLTQLFDSKTGYLYHGEYDTILEAFLQAGFTLDQFMIIDQADVIRDQDQVMLEVYTSCGIEPILLPKTHEQILNTGKYTCKMSLATFQRLQDYYLPHMIRLSKMTKREFSFTGVYKQADEIRCESPRKRAILPAVA